MSMYADFFVRNKDNFIPINDFSRSTKVYEIIHGFAPWEKIKAIETNQLDRFIDEAQDGIEKAKEGIVKEKEQIQLISQFNNTAQEKMEYIQDCQNAIEEYECIIEEYEYAKYFFIFLGNMIDAVRYSDDEDKANINEYIYVGIEIGEPTVEDIEN